VAAEALVEEIATLADELRQPLYDWEATWLRTVVVLLRGDLGRAEALAGKALELGQRTRDTDALSIYGAQLAMIRAEQGRLAELKDGVRAFAEEFRDIAAWQVGWATTLAATGDDEGARRELDRLARQRFADLPVDFVWLSALAMLAGLCHRLGDADRALVVSELLAPFAEHNVMTADRQSWGSAARYLGLCAATLGRLDDAAAHLEAAVAANEAMGARGWLAHSRFDLARVLLDRRCAGDAGRAAALVAEARQAAAELGMAALLSELDQLPAADGDAALG
jgi:tetratricopeptide (TPR) repeat protein